MKIVTTQNGFIFNETQYTFEGKIEIISESQCYAPTNLGTILLDLLCTINGVHFTDINLFVQSLKGE